MKKITILSLHLGVGGIEKYISSLTKLLENDYEIELIITYKLKETPAFPFSDKIKITYLIDGGPNRDEIKRAFKRKKFFKLGIELVKAIKILTLKKQRTKKAIKNISTDYLITTRNYETKLVNKLLKNKDIRKIATTHNFPTKKYKKELIKITTNFDKIIVVNKEIENIYKKEIGDKVTCIYNFLDELSKEHSELNEKRLVAVGRFSHEKGFIDLIEIMSLIVQKDKDIKLTLIGDGPGKDIIISKIKELGLESNIILTGYLNVREIGAEELNSSIYVMTSYTEALPLVLIEAMDRGLPCVAFDSASGAREILSNEVGILIKNRDKELFASTIINLLNSKKDLKKYSESSLKKVKEFTAKEVKSTWMNLLEEVGNKSYKKVMFISSTGGHFNELLMLKSMFQKYNYQIITEKTETNKNLKNKYGKRNIKFLIYGTRKHFLTYPFKLLINCFKSLYFYIKFRPKYIVTTGAHTAGPMCCIGKIFGSKIIYIETFANSHSKTVTGSLVYKFADLFIVQWESMLNVYEKATYGGWIY